MFVAVHTNAPMALSRALVHDMMRQRWGRIVNVTTSLGTMIRDGSPTYGPSKAALEAFSAIMAKDLAGTGVTVNVMVPGGLTNTGMIPDEVPYAREDMIQPEVMVPPLTWLVSETASGVTGRRFLGVDWRPGTAAGTGRGDSRRAGRLDRHRDNADRATAARLILYRNLFPRKRESRVTDRAVALEPRLRRGDKDFRVTAKGGMIAASIVFT